MYISAYPTINMTNIDAMEFLPTLTTDVFITEYLPSTNTTGNFPDGKWVEILNNGSTMIDVAGWSITNGKGDLLYFDPGTMVFNQTHTGITEN